MNNLSVALYRTILMLGVGAGLGLAKGTASPENLIFNPGFEIARGNVPVSWRLGHGADGNTFDWVQDDGTGADVHSGRRSLRMNATPERRPRTARWTSPRSRFTLRPRPVWKPRYGSKRSDVVSRGTADWYGLRVTLTAHDDSGGVVEHWDLTNEEGTFSWKKIQGGMLVPEGTATMDLSIKLTTATGTVWVDDAQVTVAEELPVVNLEDIHNPVLIPHPWQARLNGGSSICAVSPS